MTILKKHWQLTLFVIAVLSISGYLFYQSQQKPDLQITETDVKISDPATEKVPVGDTSQGGHWHGNEWHAEPHTTDRQTDTPIAQRTDSALSETDTTEDTDTRSSISSINTTPPNITTQTPPDDYHGDPLYWIHGMQYETLSVSSGEPHSEPVIPPEKLARYNEASQTDFGDDGKRLTTEEREQRMIEILAEGMSDLDAAKFLAMIGYQEYASEYAQRVIEADPNNFEAHLVLADLLPSAGTEADWRRLVEWKPNSVRALLNLGASVKDDKEAIRYLKKSAQLDPTYLNYNAFVQLSNRYQQIGDYEKALVVLKKLQEKFIGNTYWIEQQIEAIEEGKPLGEIYR